ncbi:MAG: hypothetical protein US42_C0013G0006 [Candidatus Magasanikbacteria bacterium GW2011_GWC2_37_14]|uniref:Uncharacterized protein n=1 Tax=Candidatus Magasanikbacteria bacterium GW2011_GWC2_37_14 TaxID=1619046 RepID=A0A0G0GB73_9BACT|nr:MAG: hypothetical protein US42_C0013G0006 [Candidatus Magasanikbacteria bacterium GW2011_GWC2_37_14]
MAEQEKRNVVQVDFFRKQKMDPGDFRVTLGKKEPNAEENEKLKQLEAFLSALGSILEDLSDVEFANELREAFLSGRGAELSVLCNPHELSQWNLLLEQFLEAIAGRGGINLTLSAERMQEFLFKLKNKFKTE